MLSLQTTTTWLRESVLVYATDDRVLQLRGDDAQSWLSGQITADLRAVSRDHAIYALAVTLKGRIVSDMWVVQRDAGLAIVAPSACADAAFAGFEKHIIMEDVCLEPAPSLTVVTVQGPRSEALRPIIATLAPYGATRLSAVGFDIWIEASQLPETLAALRDAAAAAGGGTVDRAAWDALHVALAVPRAAVDFGGDSYPQEAGLKSRALAFNKGCYIGQEVVYMLENRGQLSRRLVQLRGPEAALTPGTALTDGEGKRLGEVTSSVACTDGSSLALGYVKRAHSEPGQQLRSGDSVVQVTHVVGTEPMHCPIVAT